MIFAYLGPPARKPVLPRYDILEDLRPDQELLCTLGGFGSTGDASLEVVPYSSFRARIRAIVRRW